MKAGGRPVPDDPVFSPAYFWMWNGKLDAAKLCAQLEDMRLHGLRNVCIHPFPKGFRDWFPTEMAPDYLTGGYLDVFTKVIRRAGELGMHAYLYDEGGWPSGGACGLVAASDSEQRFMPREIALGQDGKPSVGLRKYPQGRAPYPSLIERGTTHRFIELTHDAYAKSLGSDVGTTVRIAFTDEPDMPRDCAGKSLAWTDDFAAEFMRRKDYDIRPHVPALIADGTHTNGALAKVRIDMMDVRADLYVERYLAPKNGSCGWHFGVGCKGVRADIQNGNIAADAKWTSDARITKRGYEVELSIDFESIGAEITQENRFGVCFARMATPRTPDEKRDFSSWKGDHPQSVSSVGSIFVNVE